MAYKSKKSTLEGGLTPVDLRGKGAAAAAAGTAGIAPTGGGVEPARAGVRVRMTALAWYAQRRALVDADEDPAENDRRLFAGEALARLHDAAYRRQRVTGRYEARSLGTGSAALGQGDRLHVLNEEARRAFRDKFEALPNRVRSVLHLCVIEDQFVGRSRMERLRCGLDKLVEIDQAKKVVQKDTKCIDDRAVL